MAEKYAGPTLDSTPADRGPGGAPKLRRVGKALTLAIINAMRPGDELADPEHKGLRVRCVAQKSGRPAMVFSYRYRNPAGLLRQVQVGVLGPMTLADIRFAHQDLQLRVRNGEDPRAARVAEQEHTRGRVAAAAAERTQALTVQRVIEQYLTESVEPGRKAKGAKEVRRLLTQFVNLRSWVAEHNATAPPERRWQELPKSVRDVARLPAESFTREMAAALLAGYGPVAPRAGGMVRQELRAAWNHAIDQGRLPAPNPFARWSARESFGGRALVSASTRDRHLTDEETGHLLRWMAQPGTYSRTVRDALELVLRTGLRSGEVVGIHSGELVRRDGVLWLDIPPSRMKGKRPHSVPLVGRAEQIALARLPDGSGYLFPAKGGKKPIEQKVLGVEVYACSGRSVAEAYAHRKICPVREWAPHDLRRTARSMLAELGCPYEVGESILAHQLKGVAAVYNKASHVVAKIEWLTRLSDHLDQITQSEPKLLRLKSDAA